jgi:putative tryptophan/tyrosine transport system substrate-binding protein
MNIRRRPLLIGGVTLLAASGTVLSQTPGKVRRVGFLWGGSKVASEESGAARAFADGMREAGYREQADYVVESRYAGGHYSELEAIAQEVVRNNYDVIVTTGAAATQAVQKLTTTTPVVFAIVNDATGFVKSLAHPGGNLTGLTRNTVEISPKHLEFLRIVAPKLNRVGLLANPGNPSHASVRNAVGEAAHAIGVTVVGLDARDLEEITRAFGRARELRVEAVIVPVDQLFVGYKREIAMLALKGRLPSMYATPDDVREGGLMSYGPVYSEFFRQSARYVDRIIKGMKPADLPVEQPTKYELAINMRTAKALGITIPQSLLVRADEVLE